MVIFFSDHMSDFLNIFTDGVSSSSLYLVPAEFRQYPTCNNFINLSVTQAHDKGIWKKISGINGLFCGYGIAVVKIVGLNLCLHVVLQLILTFLIIGVSAVLLSRGRVDTAIWMHYMEFNKMNGE